MTTAPTRTRNVAATRDRIVEAAREVFISRGYRAASLRDVAAAADISHPGLLKHFATKDMLLTAVIAGFDRSAETVLADRDAARDAGALLFSSVAARNETIEGYLALYAALVGEGSTRGHPAHAAMRERYSRLREVFVAQLSEARTVGAVHPRRDVHGEAIRIAAVWDGLQLLQLYLPRRVDLVALLTEMQEMLVAAPGSTDPAGPDAGEGVAASASPAPWPALDLVGEEPEATQTTEGYRVGRERRSRIVRDATALFARDGYAETSLRGIAERVGVSKSTLLHHYPSKDALLRAVLAERDRAVSVSPPAHVERAADALRDLPRNAAANAASAPGLIEVYAVLSCEALPPDHPAHDYFAQRFATTIEYFTAVLRAAQRDGDLPTHRDPAREAIRLVALWDGLQYQWLYDRESVDVAAELAAHLDDILPRR
ncbi:hypothetical protein HMPREF1529_00738 [Microbacterium sp. oral taxon 186 str. F0373]|uniref:TetR/AcrR family transcriptional regulator n=1 Tax=Microbacterium sp. oral taxon 186 TaxID=712383 RepID=UPI00034E2400|nr:TetR/AcrR family transcriptional regulator [Microbacterium sp. oral taxon 186]EPD85726.1 hypothetical protein HMPREF1529_00738 [Microbacterium sp. oral taxon 186 str. F0373]